VRADIWHESAGRSRLVDVPPEKREPSPLVNALWGRGIQAPKLAAGQARSFRLAMFLMAALSGAFAGVLGALADGVGTGVGAGIFANALVLLVFAWIRRDMFEDRG